jgi:hypothetical protein
VAGRQEIIIPPGHMIAPLIYSEVCVCPIFDLHFLKDLWDWLLFVIYIISISEESFNESINQFHLCSKHDIFGKYSTFHSHENASVPPFSTASCTPRCHTIKIKFLPFIWAENHSKDMVSVANLDCETAYLSQVM